jgi:hypothetical protein
MQSTYNFISKLLGLQGVKIKAVKVNNSALEHMIFLGTVFLYTQQDVK